MTETLREILPKLFGQMIVKVRAIVTRRRRRPDQWRLLLRRLRRAGRCRSAGRTSAECTRESKVAAVEERIGIGAESARTAGAGAASAGASRMGAPIEAAHAAHSGAHVQVAEHIVVGVIEREASLQHNRNGQRAD